jgi:hypothetical protein
MIKILREIWKTRCEENIKWEKDQGINTKEKRTKSKRRKIKLEPKTNKNRDKQIYIQDTLITRAITDGVQIHKNNFYYILSSFHTNTNTNGALAR